jgi:DNA-binding IclR family transcriptional regulator
MSDPAALAAAVAEARADGRSIPHSEVRAWLLEIAAGNFDAPAPIPR